jgi:hypothetical protein
MDSQLGLNQPLLDMRMMLPLPPAVGMLKVNKAGMSRREEKVENNECHCTVGCCSELIHVYKNEAVAHTRRLTTFSSLVQSC